MGSSRRGIRLGAVAAALAVAAAVLAQQPTELPPIPPVPAQPPAGVNLPAIPPPPVAESPINSARPKVPPAVYEEVARPSESSSTATALPSIPPVSPPTPAIPTIPVDLPVQPAAPVAPAALPSLPQPPLPQPPAQYLPPVPPPNPNPPPVAIPSPTPPAAQAQPQPPARPAALPQSPTLPLPPVSSPVVAIPPVPAAPTTPNLPTAPSNTTAAPAGPVSPALLPAPTRLTPGASGLPGQGRAEVPVVPRVPVDTGVKTEPPKPEPKSWVVGENLGMTARWNHGLHVETIDKAFRIHPVGRLQYDNAFMAAGPRVQFAPGGVGRVDDATAFRRLRIGVEGTLWEVFDFWLEPDYFNTFNAERANGDRLSANTPAATDMWGQLTHIPWIGNFRFGSVKPVYSFEHLTSSRFLSFMERSLQFDAFVGGIDNGFQPGFVLFNWSKDERVTWAASMTHNTTNVFGFNVGDGEFNYAARMTGLPVYADEGRQLVHLGMSYNHRSLDDRQERYRGRTLVRNGPATLGTPLVDILVAGDSRDMIIPEFVAVLGPLSVQAEYLGTWVHGVSFPPGGTDFGTTYFQGAYIDFMYFLTGESRPYDRKMGVFTRVVPFENFFLVRQGNGRLGCGTGAWQVGARYSYLDLNSKGLGGGIVHDLTLGVNWFWNPNMKWQWNYSLARRDVPGAVGNGIVQGLGIRFAMDF